MANTVKNKQFLETEEKIEAVYRELRQNLPLEKISVSKICKEAGINRSSFYYHYLDVFDLNDKLVYKVNERLALKLGEADRDFLTRDNLLVYLQHIKDEKETYKLLLQAKISFPIQYSYEPFKAFLKEKERYKDQSEEELKLSIVYVQAGFTHLIHQWLAEDCHLPVAQLVDLFLKELD